MPIKPGLKIEAKEPKRPSQRLRAVIFRYWEQLGSGEDFELFYERHVDRIIEQYKSKLTPRV